MLHENNICDFQVADRVRYYGEGGGGKEKGTPMMIIHVRR